MTAPAYGIPGILVHHEDMKPTMCELADPHERFRDPKCGYATCVITWGDGGHTTRSIALCTHHQESLLQGLLFGISDGATAIRNLLMGKDAEGARKAAGVAVVVDGEMPGEEPRLVTPETPRSRRREPSITVVRRLEATQFWPDMKPWPDGVSETWDTAPRPPSQREIAAMNHHQLLHASRQGEANRQVMQLHADGYTHYLWLDTEALGLKAGHWIVRGGVRVRVHSDEEFRKLYIEVH